MVDLGQCQVFTGKYKRQCNGIYYVYQIRGEARGNEGGTNGHRNYTLGSLHSRGLEGSTTTAPLYWLRIIETLATAPDAPAKSKHTQSDGRGMPRPVMREGRSQPRPRR